MSLALIRYVDDVGVTVLINPANIIYVTVVPAREDHEPHRFNAELGFCAHVKLSTGEIVVLHDRDLDRLYKRLEVGDERA